MKNFYPKLFDTHCHLNFNAFKNDAHLIIDKCLTNNIWVVIVGTQYDTSKRAVDLAKNYKLGVYASIGLHPVHLKETYVDESEIDPLLKFRSRAEVFDIKNYQNLILKNKNKVVAIGEIGLDYKNLQDPNDKKLQKNEFIKQVYFALKYNLPVILHCRDAYSDILDILKTEFKNKGLKGVSHFFSGSVKEARSFLNLGFNVSFAGPITFSNQRDAVIKYVPLEQILVETDSPYAAPIPHRGKRNIPLYVDMVVQKIAQIKNLSPEIVSNITTKNAITLFNIQTQQ